MPRCCGNFNGQYRDLLFIGAAPLDGIDRLSYVTVVALTAGTMAVNLFAYRMAFRAADSYASNLNASEMASSGILRYLFLFIRLSRFIM